MEATVIFPWKILAKYYSVLPRWRNNIAVGSRVINSNFTNQLFVPNIVIIIVPHGSSPNCVGRLGIYLKENCSWWEATLLLIFLGLFL